MTSTTKQTRNPDDILYFAYASNMWSRRIHICNPTAKFLDIGELEGYHVDFFDYFESWRGASAALRKCDGKITHGVIWAVPKQDVHNLDRQESDYEGVDVTVKLSSGEEAVCRTYIYGHTKAGKRGVPSLFYKAVIVAGAIEHKLPETYVQQLVKQPDNGNVQGVSVPLDVGELRSSVKGYLSL
ncbi:gamma-glutamylcyclotransferase-like [Rhipicephalus sanguineus]|uniref:gamma-glutamylcyclotransferase-like n=1 Tax=Rhipicephalus sanguineus TaxID=34632 RepID=UPI0018935100|nr:gamma-glutamylcyclotransferase-like [Rhipicephalus sanguineus]